MEKFAKIIAIDDDPIILTLVRHILKHHTVETAQSGEQGSPCSTNGNRTWSCWTTACREWTGWRC